MPRRADAGAAQGRTDEIVTCHSHAAFVEKNLQGSARGARRTPATTTSARSVSDAATAASAKWLSPRAVVACRSVRRGPFSNPPWSPTSRTPSRNPNLPIRRRIPIPGLLGSYGVSSEAASASAAASGPAARASAIRRSASSTRARDTCTSNPNTGN